MVISNNWSNHLVYYDGTLVNLYKFLQLMQVPACLFKVLHILLIFAKKSWNRNNKWSCRVINEARRKITSLPIISLWDLLWYLYYTWCPLKKVRIGFGLYIQAMFTNSSPSQVYSKSILHGIFWVLTQIINVDFDWI